MSGHRMYHVKLSSKERGQLEGLTRSGATSVRRHRRARVLLLADEAPTGCSLCDAEIASACGLSATR